MTNNKYKINYDFLYNKEENIFKYMITVYNNYSIVFYMCNNDYYDINCNDIQFINYFNTFECSNIEPEYCIFHFFENLDRIKVSNEDYDYMKYMFRNILDGKMKKIEYSCIRKGNIYEVSKFYIFLLVLSDFAKDYYLSDESDDTYFDMYMKKKDNFY